MACFDVFEFQQILTTDYGVTCTKNYSNSIAEIETRFLTGFLL